jgi:predicted kinase
MIMAHGPFMFLVIVTGAPAAGKTTVGRRIAEAFRLPFIHKDGIKEILFDSLGWKDREWSKKLSATSMELLFYLVEVQLRAGRPSVVESNFHPEHATPRFLALEQNYHFRALQVVCTANAEALVRRYGERVSSGVRHPGHVDEVLLDELDFTAQHGRFHALAIGGPVVQVDTSDFDAIDYQGLFQSIASEMDR